MTERSRQPEEVLATVSGMIREVIGEEWAKDVSITMDTSFTDLELESIEFVVLADKIQQHYQNRVKFAEWLADMELDAIISLRVGQLVEFIVRCQ
jgi:acyl carrier protein